MRIRSSSSASSSYTSDSTSLTPSNTISFSSTSSNSSSTSSASIDSITRSEGLDLLIKAVVHVAGSLLVVPFTQRRVIRRRRSAFKFIKKQHNEHEEEDQEEDEKAEEDNIEVILKDNKRKREMALPLKYHDSVLQPWKRCSRRSRSSKTNPSSLA